AGIAEASAFIGDRYDVIRAALFFLVDRNPMESPPHERMLCPASCALDAHGVVGELVEQSKLTDVAALGARHVLQLLGGVAAGERVLEVLEIKRSALVPRGILSEVVRHG